MLTMSDEITTSDATISAPKSVSLAALIGGDGRIRNAYRESVNDALKEFEKYLQARGGGPPSRSLQTIARNEPRSRINGRILSLEERRNSTPE